jgi:two-component system, sporulation sensor kinase E
MKRSNDLVEENLSFAYRNNSILDRSGELFKSLFAEAIDGIIFADHEGRIVLANHSALKIFECTSEELMNKEIWDYVYQKDQHFYKVMKESEVNKAVRDELVFLMPNGQLKNLEFTYKAHSIAGYDMAIFRNVSERYYFEQTLKDSEERFRKVFEGTLDGMILWNKQNVIIDINPVAASWLGVSREKIIGRNLIKLLNFKGREQKVIEIHQEELEREGKSDMLLPVQGESGGHFYEVSSKGNLASNLNLTVIREITEKMALQEQLRKSDTLTVVGELAAGIAHEIRNPMTALKGFIQLLQLSIKEDHSLYFNVITSELARIESIITDFLVLAKPQAIEFKNHPINSIMNDTLDLLNAQALMHNVQFEVDNQENLPDVFCEPNQIKQVFINIIKNAIEVMPNGGRIRIKIQQSENEFVHIIIQDEGMGIPKDKINKLGEPFYTTKERGTGLGLMISFKIIKEHKGRIEVESEEGSGSVFHIYIPVHAS